MSFDPNYQDALARGVPIIYSPHMKLGEVYLMRDPSILFMTLPTLAQLLAEKDLLAELDHLEDLLSKEAHRRLDYLASRLSWPT